MNEAELTRIIGGRSRWESLKAALNQWSTDPSKANSITPAQRQDIQKLVNEMRTRVGNRLRAVDDAEAELIDADDVGLHRKIVAKAKKTLSDEVNAVIPDPPKPSAKDLIQDEIGRARGAGPRQ
jgi:hypothetical protein